MKKTKRFVSLIAIFIISILALSCAFLFACGKSDDEESGSSETVHVHTYGTPSVTDTAEGSDGTHTVTVTYTCTDANCPDANKGILTTTFTYEAETVVVPGETVHTHVYGNAVWDTANAVDNGDGTFTVKGTLSCTAADCPDTDKGAIEVSYIYTVSEGSEETVEGHTHAYGTVEWDETATDNGDGTFTVKGKLTCTANDCPDTDKGAIEVSYTYMSEDSGNTGNTGDTHTHVYGEVEWDEENVTKNDDGSFTMKGTLTCTDEECPDEDKGEIEVTYTYWETEGEHVHVYGEIKTSTKNNGDGTYTVTMTLECSDSECPDPDKGVITSTYTYTGSGEAAGDHTHSFESVTAGDITWNWDELAWGSNGTTGHITATVKCDECGEDVTFRATVESTTATADDGDICQNTDANPVKYTATVTIGEIEYTDLVLISGHNIEKVEYEDATCEEAGTYEYYKCTNNGCDECFSDGDGTTILTDEQISALEIPATGHTLPMDNSSEYYVWDLSSNTNLVFGYSDVNQTVTVKVLCTVCGEEIENTTLTATINNVVVGTTDMGLGTCTYTAATTLGDGNDAVELTLTYTFYTAGEHTAPDPDQDTDANYIVFDWIDAATTGEVAYTIYCAKSEHVDGVTQLTDILAQGSVAYTSAVTTEPTCENAGTVTYSATVSITIGNTTYTYTDEKTKELAALEHDLTKVVAVEATCATTGNIEYWVCSTCGEYFVADATEDSGYKKIIDKNSVITEESEVHTIPDLTDNTTGYVVWNWTEENNEVTSVTVDIYCSVCGGLITTLQGNAVTFVKDETTSYLETCGVTGLNVYIGTAVFETTIGSSVIGSITMTDTHSVIVPATGNHTYTAGSHVEWEFEYLEYNESTQTYTGKAFVTCEVCGYVHEITASVTVDDTEAADCENAGKTVYSMTASVGDNPNTVEYTFTYTVEHEALGHKLAKTEAKDPTCGDEGNIEYYTCERCNKLFADAEGTIGITQTDTVIAALGHSYPVDSDENYADCVFWTWTPIYEEEVFTGNYTVTLTIYCSTCGEEVLYSTTANDQDASENYEVKSGSGYILISTVTFGEYIYTSEYDTSADTETDYVHSHEWVVVWTWAESKDDADETVIVCYVTITCSICGVTSGSQSATVTVVTTDSTCLEVSKTEYKATYTWTTGTGEELTFTTEGDDIKPTYGDFIGTHTIEKVDEVAATCEADGVAAHYKCTVCGKLFSDENGTIEISEEDLVIPAAHTIPEYSTDIADLFVWVLTGDEVVEDTVTIEVYCSVCDKLATTITATITSIDAETQAPTCEDEGSIIYTATTGTGLEIVTYTWTVTVDALGHTYPTSTNDMFTTDGTNFQYAVVWGSITATDGGYSVLVNVYCTVCGEELTESTTYAPAINNGDGSYTAILELDGHEYTYTWGSSTGTDYHEHNYDVKFDWSWELDEETGEYGYVVTVTFTCTTDGCDEPEENTVVTATVTVGTVDVGTKLEATCEEAGWIIYTATVEHNGLTYTETKTDGIVATGHTNVTKVDAVDPDCSTQEDTQEQGKDGHVDVWYCSDCNKYFGDEECTIEITAENSTDYIIPWAHTYTENSRITWVWMEDDTTESGFMVIVGVYCVECDEVGYYVYIDTGIEIIDSKASTCVINGDETYEVSVTITLTDEDGNEYDATYTSTYVKELPLDDEVHTYTKASIYTFIWMFDAEKGWIAYIEITCDEEYDKSDNKTMLYDTVVVTTIDNITYTATFTTAEDVVFTEDFTPVATPDAEADKAGLLLGGSEDDGSAVYAEGFNYEITVNIETDEDGNVTYVYILDGDASAMSEDVASWFGDDVDAGEAYVTLKIYVPEGYTISYTSANGAGKSYTNSEGENAEKFIDGYFFVIVRLTSVDENGNTYVRTSNTYTISGTDEDGNEVSWTIEAKFGNIELPEQYVYNFSDAEFVESIKDAFANTHKKGGDGTEEETEWDARDSEEIALDENGFLTLVDYVTSSGYKTDGTKSDRLSTGGSTTTNSGNETGLSNYLVVDLSEVTGTVIISIEFTSSGSGDTASEERSLYVSTVLMAGSSAGSDSTGVILGSATSTGNDESNATLVVELDTADYNDLEALYIIYSGSLYIYNITITVVSD